MENFFVPRAPRHEISKRDGEVGFSSHFLKMGVVPENSETPGVPFPPTPQTPSKIGGVTRTSVSKRDGCVRRPIRVPFRPVLSRGGLEPRNPRRGGCAPLPIGWAWFGPFMVASSPFGTICVPFWRVRRSERNYPGTGLFRPHGLRPTQIWGWTRTRKETGRPGVPFADFASLRHACLVIVNHTVRW